MLYNPAIWTHMEWFACITVKGIFVCQFLWEPVMCEWERRRKYFFHSFSYLTCSMQPTFLPILVWYKSWTDAWIASTCGCSFVFSFFMTFAESKADKLLHQPLFSISRRHTQKICEQNAIWHVNKRQTAVEKYQIIKFKKEPKFRTSHNTMWYGRQR